MTASRPTRGLRLSNASSLAASCCGRHKADHVYEDRIKEALEEYRELMSSELESRY